MKKILISYLGTGVRYINRNDANIDITERDSSKYERTNYRFDGDNGDWETPFILEALMRKERPDCIFLYGTVKSIWAELCWNFYNKLDDQSKRRAGVGDDEVYLEFITSMDEMRRKGNHAMPLNKLRQKDISFLTNILQQYARQYFHMRNLEVHIQFLRYGINQEELIENFEQLYFIEKSLEDDNEIILDVTHGFRSLPMLQFVFTDYLHQLSQKPITVNKIYYAMLEVKNELGYAPVVNLSMLTDLLDWSTGISELKRYGSVRRISELLENRTDEMDSQITEFYNFLNDFEYGTATNEYQRTYNAIKKFQRINVEQLSGLRPYEKKLAEFLLAGFKQRFPERELDAHNEDEGMAKFQLRMAEWYIQEKRYGFGAIVIQEAVITYLCCLLKRIAPEFDGWRAEIYSGEITNRDFRDAAYRALKDLASDNGPNKQRDLLYKYDRMQPYRNRVAHFLRREVENKETEVKNIEEYLSYIKDIIIGDSSGKWKEEFVNHGREIFI